MSDRLYKKTDDAIKAFKDGVEKSKKDENGNPEKYEQLLANDSINVKAIKQAAKFAFPDITPRTMTRDIAKAEITNKFDELPEKLINHKKDDNSSAFVNMIEAWFERPKEDVGEKEFDILHQNACETVIDFLKKAGYNESCCTYGKAQKIVNMTFKHLRCMNGAEKKEEWFQHCHIALDSFTLEWLKRTKDKNQSKIVKGKMDSWSAIQYANGNDTYCKTDKNGKKHNYYSYAYLVKQIRNIIPKRDYSNLTPFQAEFYIWPEIQLHMAAEALFSQGIGEDKACDLMCEKDFAKAKAKFKVASLTNKMSILQNLIEEYSMLLNNTKEDPHETT